MNVFSNFRRICPNDIPYTKSLTYWYKFSSGKRKIDTYWLEETIEPIMEPNISYKEGNRRLRQFTNIINKEDHIVQIFPKYGVGKYNNNLKVIRIHPEIVSFNYSINTYKLYETTYYIVYNNEVHFVNESKLKNIMEKETIYRKALLKPSNIKWEDSSMVIIMYYKGNINEKCNQEIHIQELLMKHPFDFMSIASHTRLPKDIDSIINKYTNWRVYQSTPILEEEYNEHLQGEKLTHSVFKNRKDLWTLETTYDALIHKLKTENLLKKNNTKKEETVQKKEHRRPPKKRSYGKDKSYIRNHKAKELSYNPPVGKDIFVQIANNAPRKLPAWQVDRLVEKHSDVKVLSTKEYNEYIAITYPRKTAVINTVHVDGNRSTRNHHKKTLGHTDINGFHLTVKQQYHSKPLVTFDKEGNPIYKDKRIAKHGQRFDPLCINQETGKPTDKFITNHNLSGSLIIIPKKYRKYNKEQVGTKTINRLRPMRSTDLPMDEVKPGKVLERVEVPVYKHNYGCPKDTVVRVPYIVPPKNRITKHDAKKNVNSELLSLKEKYSKDDRRYNNFSSTEKWSTDFFTILKMVKNKERHKKIISFMKSLDYSEEYIIGFIKYLHLTRNGDPTRDHKSNPIISYKKEKITKPHLEIKLPEAYKDVIIIEHEHSNNDTGKIETLLTPNTYMNYQNSFFKLDEDKKQVFINRAKNVSKWMLQSEYNESTKDMSPDDIKNFDKTSDKWHPVTNITKKDDIKITRINRKLPKKKKGSPKEWKCPMPSIEESVSRRISILQTLKDDKILFNYIGNIILPSMKKGSGFYSALVDELYQHNIDYSTELSNKILAAKDKEEDWVIFAESIVGIPFH